MSESMDKAEAGDEVKMIATNIERLKIKTSEASRIREWSNNGERLGKAALDSPKIIYVLMLYTMISLDSINE